MKARSNIEVRVTIEVVEIDVYNPKVHVKASKSLGGTMTTKDMASIIKALTLDTKTQALEVIDALAAQDEAEEVAAEKEKM